ncbi:hypothetical protein NPIL_398011 [Nephila pilipes]|uniref:Uncharacterized protein n=1 Tax=Nephila pilipes TaxID=299642 RepID=A0A8X6MUT4_NEPPI|nr:hypothetical protein NPIL_398011 [Nephila pilipes]
MESSSLTMPIPPSPRTVSRAIVVGPSPWAQRQRVASTTPSKTFGRIVTNCACSEIILRPNQEPISIEN